MAWNLATSRFRRRRTAHRSGRGAGENPGAAAQSVKNNGPNPSGRFQVGFTNCTFICTGGMPYWAWGSRETYQAPLAPGQQASTTISFSFDANTPGCDIQARLTVVAVDTTNEISDLNPADNITVFHIRLS